MSHTSTDLTTTGSVGTGWSCCDGSSIPPSAGGGDASIPVSSSGRGSFASASKNFMKLKSIKIKNFMSVGENPIYIEFEKLGNIVVVKGKNHDVRKSDPISNGSGKSTIFEGIVYSLFGKTIRNISHAELINKKTKKKLEVELKVEIKNKNYTIIRTRKPDGLKVFEDETEITLGGIPATQELLDGIIKLSYNAFINISCFGQHNDYDFLSCDAATKRKIVESLLSLEKYNCYVQHAKAGLADLNLQLKEKRFVLEQTQKNIRQYQSKLEQINEQNERWSQEKNTQMQKIKDLIQAKTDSLNNTEPNNKILEYENIQKEIHVISQNIAENQENKEQASIELEKFKDKSLEIRGKVVKIENAIDNENHKVNAFKAKIKSNHSKINSLLNLDDGQTCAVCMGVISSENYAGTVEFLKNEITEFEMEIENFNAKIAEYEVKTGQADVALKTLNERMKTIKGKIAVLDKEHESLRYRLKQNLLVEKPEISNKSEVLYQQIVDLNGRLIQLESEILTSPYEQMIESIGTEIKDLIDNLGVSKREIDELNELIPYWGFWTQGFGDYDGIKSFIIDSVIPALNNRIEFWIEKLIDGKLKLTFDSNLEETITRNPDDGDMFIHAGMSGGEKRKLDLVVSQSFASVMIATNGVVPSMILLDESSSFMDSDGVQALFRMILELSKERQVFIITHEPVLLELLEHEQVITIVKKNNFSTLLE